MRTLSKPADFSAVLQARRRVLLQPPARYFDLFISFPATPSTAPCWRVGIAISRKSAAHAVVRNTVKRQIRAYLRACALTPKMSQDWVVRAKPSLGHGYRQAKQIKRLAALRAEWRAELARYVTAAAGETVRTS